MKCDVLDHVLGDWVDGVLPPEDVLTLETHLKDCGPCRKEATEYRQTQLLLSRLVLPPFPDDFFRRQASHILGQLKPRLLWSAPPCFLVAFLAVIAFYMALGVMGLEVRETLTLGALWNFSLDGGPSLLALYGGLVGLAFRAVSREEEEELSLPSPQT